MRLVCPKCASQYEVDISLFPEEGREVQCSNCEEVWVQYPVAETEQDPPMRLDAMSSAPEAAPPPRPSERLDEEERSNLRDAVAREIEVQGRDNERRTTFIDHSLDDEDDDDAEIVKALREQIKAEGGGDFSKKGGAAKSQKRNLRVAAEAVGVDVDVVEDDSEKRKWNLSAHDDRKQKETGRRDGLKEAIKRYENEVEPMRPRRRPVRKGFMAAVVLVILGAGVFIGRDQIAEAYPPAVPYLDQYVAAVGDARLRAEQLYAEYQPVIMAKIAELTGGPEAGAQ